MNTNRVLIVSGIAALLLVSIVIAGYIATNAESSSSFFNTNMTRESGTVRKIPVEGAISSTGGGGLFSQSQTSGELAEAIREAGNNPSVDAVLLEVNSPGGAPVASHEIVRAVDSVDKPIATQIREVGASGAYWVASATDHITADPVSVTGSVGVRASYLEFSGLLQDYNVTYQGITKGKYKDLGSPYKDLSEEERRILQSKIEAIGEYFLDDVTENRGLTPAEREQVKTGVFFVGVESKQAGLVDSLGGERTAIAYLENATNKSLSVDGASFQQSFFERISQASLNVAGQTLIGDISPTRRVTPSLR